MRLLPYLLSAVMMSASLAKLAAGEPSLAGQAASDDRVAELTGQAQQAIAAGRFDAAEAAFLELTKLEPNVAELYANLGAVYFQQGKLDAAKASMAKYWVTDLENKIIDECLQLFGGWGYMDEYPISRMYRDSRVQRIYGGSNEVMKVLIARTL